MYVTLATICIEPMSAANDPVVAPPTGSADNAPKYFRHWRDRSSRDVAEESAASEAATAVALRAAENEGWKILAAPALPAQLLVPARRLGWPRLRRPLNSR